MDTRVYEAVFPDGERLYVTANQVAKYILTSWDAYGNECMIFIEILDHQFGNKAISEEDGFIHKPKKSAREEKDYKRMAFVCKMDQWNQHLGATCQSEVIVPNTCCRIIKG